MKIVYVVIQFLEYCECGNPSYTPILGVFENIEKAKECKSNNRNSDIRKSELH